MSAPNQEVKYRLAMLSLIYALLVLSWAEFLAIAAIHIATLFGITWPFEHLPFNYVFLGLVVVFLPTIFLMNRLTRDFKQKDVWRAALRGCPPWMRGMVWVLFGYGWLGFFVLPIFYGGGMEALANKARTMSGMLMIFFLIPGAVLYSAIQVEGSDQSRKCLNGHHLSPSAKFCEECGAPAAPTETNSA